MQKDCEFVIEGGRIVAYEARSTCGKSVFGRAGFRWKRWLESCLFKTLSRYQRRFLASFRAFLRKCDFAGGLHWEWGSSWGMFCGDSGCGETLDRIGEMWEDPHSSPKRLEWATLWIVARQKAPLKQGRLNGPRRGAWSGSAGTGRVEQGRLHGPVVDRSAMAAFGACRRVSGLGGFWGCRIGVFFGVDFDAVAAAAFGSVEGGVGVAE